MIHGLDWQEFFIRSASTLGIGLVALCGTVIASIINDSVKRHNERRGLAVSLYAEVMLISAILGAFRESNIIVTALEKFITLASSEEKYTQDIPIISCMVFDKNIDKIGSFNKDLTVNIFAFYFGAKQHSDAINQVFAESNLSMINRKRLAQRTINGIPNTLEKHIPLIIELSKLSSRGWGPMGWFYSYRPANTAQDNQPKY